MKYTLWLLLACSSVVTEVTSFLPSAGHAGTFAKHARSHLCLNPARRAPGISTCNMEETGNSHRAVAAQVAAEKKLLGKPAGSSSQYHFWDWKDGWRIHYETAGAEGTPVLLLTGFGVGGFHYERNVAELAESGNRVWVMDILGQGKSWPTKDPAPGGGYDEVGFEWGFGPEANADLNAEGLTYSCTLWKDQVIDFLESVVGEQCYIAGNSLGGYLAAMVASERPDLVKGLFLMNPTPWWGVGVQRLLPWTGGYPVPSWVRPVTIPWWDTIRSPSTIKYLLSQVYADAERVGERLVCQIIEPTEQPAAASAFASILCSPSHSASFDEMLNAVDASGLKVALCYGKEDPWIVPLWGHRAKRTLPSAEYWEVTPAGHCPHHEAPEAVNALLLNWLGRMESGAEPPQQTEGDVWTVGRDAALETPGSEKLAPFTMRLRAHGTQALTGCCMPDGAEPRTLVEMLDDVWHRIAS